MTTRSDFIFLTLKDLFPNAKCELEFSNEYELLIAVSLSSQTTDIKVNKVTKELFNKYPNSLELSNANYDDVFKIIKPLGLATRKASNIINLSKKIQNDFSGEIPHNYDELITLDGVGRKCANVFLSEIGASNALAVDTHIARVSNRLNLSKSNNPIIIEKDLVKEFEGICYKDLHHLLIFFGRYMCKAKNPDCTNCPLRKECQWQKD